MTSPTLFRTACLAASVLLLAACGQPATSGHDASAAAAAAPLRQLARGDVLQARLAPVAASLPFTATLNALTSIEVAAEIDASVREVLVREGETVRRGQLLARLDGETLQQALVEQQAQLANDEARLRLARLKLDKQRELYQQGFISKLAFDEVDSEYRIREGDVNARRSQLARARKSLADTAVHSPMDGVVYARRIQPGEQVSRNQKLFAIADLSQLEATASIPARQVAQLQPGQRAHFRVEGATEPFAAQLLRINPVANAGSRTFNAYLRVDNRAGRLQAGQFVTGEVILREISDAVRLPQAAVRDADGSKPWVMLLDGNTLRRQPVSVVLRNDSERVLAVRGVEVGRTLLAAPLLGLKPGDRVALPR